jgi:hypothetical protein
VKGLAFAVLVVVAGCRSSETERQPANADSLAVSPVPDSVVVTGEAAGAPPGCSPRRIASRLVAMFDAISQAKPGIVDDFFGRQRNAPFGVFSMNEGGAPQASKNRFTRVDTWEDLAGYFEQRSQHREQIQLLRLQVNRWDPAYGLVHLGPIEVSRSADDLDPEFGGPRRVARGKGAYHCATDAVVILNFAMAYRASS